MPLDPALVGHESSRATHAVLAEGSALVRDRHAYFGRIEVVGKPGEALHIHEAPAEVFTLGKLEAGYVRYFPSWGPVVSGVGVTGSLNLVPEALASRYQGRVSTGMGAFVTLRPSRHTM